MWVILLLLAGALWVLLAFPGMFLGIGAGDSAAPVPLSLQPFSEQECQRIADRVRTLRYGTSDLFSWEKRNPIMWTLGTASYIDAASEPFYNQKASRTNAFLIAHFDWVYQRLLQTLREHWAPASVDYCKSLPGFHVFRCDSKLMRLPVASVHVDQQEKLLTWEDPVQETVSFTVPIEVPDSGAGLWIWETREKEIGHAIQLLGKRKTYVPYEPGRMALHDGKRFHMIAPVAKTQQNAFRITLQGHAVRVAGRWWVYW